MTHYRPSQLEQDLIRNAHDRFHRWISDTTMRCDIVEMDDVKQISLILSVIIDALTEAAVGVKMNREELLYLVGQVYDEELKNKSRKVKERD